MDQFLEKIRAVENDSRNMVWWKPEQIDRGEHLRDDTIKGERPWIIPETTGRFLYDCIHDHGYTRILELGTSIGYSTLWLAKALQDSNTSSKHSPGDGNEKPHIDTVERSDNKIPVAQKYFNEFGVGDMITLHHTRISEFLQTIPDDTVYDCMFLDADRGHYHEYLPILQQHLSPNGVIIADNAGNMQTRMQPFLDLLTEYGFHWEILDIDNGLLVARKNPLIIS
jgi:predicted O-methyltransferase YrrM